METEMIDVHHESELTCIPDSARTDRALRLRICAEYLEMPGMRLSVPQAARLFNVERTQCTRALNALVTAGVLWTNGREYFRGAGRRSA